jgi:H+/Cl- antiporter ClcA
VLYARGSGGRVKKGIPVIALVIAVGIVGSFFAAVAVDLYDVFPKLDPEISSTYASRGEFVRTNLFYGPVLEEYSRDIVLFVLFGVLGGFGTILRLVRMNASLQR